MNGGRSVVWNLDLAILLTGADWYALHYLDWVLASLPGGTHHVEVVAVSNVADPVYVC